MKKTSPKQEIASPLLRTFQFDEKSFGNIANWVNLFRGEVCTALDLVTLAGRNGLELRTSVLYSSSVWEEASNWNRSAPTSVLGLGWTLPVDAIVATPNGTGRIEEFTYTLMSSGSGNALIFKHHGESGELVFELLDYAFRPIRYFPSDERWEIIREDGVVQIYGGGITVDENGNRHANGNSVAWGVGFGNWIGAGVGGNQRQYGLTWYLSKICGAWEDRIVYSYRADEFPIDQDGLAYTRATYLDTIVDVFGRKLQFNYIAKETFEFQPPGPAVYQEQYETCYLSQLLVCGPDGEPITSIAFEYSFQNVVNPGVQDEFSKRCLTSITESSMGSELPGYLFSYGDANSSYPGALTNVIHPLGGRVDFSYEQQTLSATSNNTGAQSKNGIPRIWFGPDYAVVTWYSDQLQHLEIDIYSWVGTWLYAGSPDVLTGVQLDLQDLNVSVQEKFFVLSFPDTGTGGPVQATYLYETDQNRVDTWTSTLLSMPLHPGALRSTILTGPDFVVLANTDFADGTPVIRLVKAPGAAAWTRTQPAQAGSGLLALAAGDACYVQCAYDPATSMGEFQLWYLQDYAWELGSQWGEKFTVATTGASMAQTWQDTFLSMGQGFVIGTNITGLESAQGLADYEVRAYAWDQQYHLLARAATWQHRDRLDIPFTPAIIHGATVANAQHLVRFDGSNWHVYDLPVSSSLDAASVHLAYGDDVAVASTTQGTTLATFDPAALAWTATVLTSPFGSATIGGDCLTVGTTVYQRQPDRSWQEQETGLPLDTIDGSVRNTGRCIVFERAEGSSASACFIKNGGLTPTLAMPGPPQSIATKGAASGTQLVGSRSFASYPVSSGSLDESSQLYLYYLLHDSVAGAQVARRVNVVTVDPGMDGDANICTAYLYDDISVLYDPFGHITKYHQVRKVTGADPSNLGTWDAPGPAPFGSVITSYFNGRAPDSLGAVRDLPGNSTQYYRWLDGMFVGTTTYDSMNNMVASTTNAWQVATTRVASGQTLPLVGAYSRLLARTSQLDGVVKAESFAYDPASGMRVVQAVDVTQLDGSTMQSVRRSTSWWSIYDPDQSTNRLTPVVQVVKTSVDESGVETVIMAEATTWKNAWGDSNSDWAAFETFQLTQQPGSGFSGFNAWGPGQNPDPVWRKVKSVVARSCRGQETETLDVDQVPSSVIYTVDGNLPLVQARNASVARQSLAYCGFEANEQATDARWVYSVADLTAADCYTGSRCLAMPPDGAATARIVGEFAPTGPDQGYLLSFCARNRSCATGGYAELTFSAGGGQPVQFPIDLDSPDWQYQSFAVSLQDIDGSADTVKIAFFNSSVTQTILIDDVRFVPLCAEFEARTFDPTSFSCTTRIAHDGRTRRYLYDGFQRLIASTDRDVRPDAFNLTYLSREGNPTFSGADPNMAVQIVSNGGHYNEFRSADWEDNWTATAGAWAVVDHALTLTGAAPGSVTNSATAVAEQGGVRAFVVPPTTVTQPFGIMVGGVSVSWAPLRGWQLTVNGAVCASVAAESIVPGEWMLVCVETLVCFFFMGKQVFSQATSQAATGAATLFAGDAVRFSEVMILQYPQVMATFTDGAGRKRQKQVLDGAGCNVTAYLYDAAGNAAVQSKACAYSGALAYRSGMISAFDWVGGRLQGDLADYYGPGGAGPSDDAGYPYWRTLFDDSPLGRPVEKGNPGTTYAIDLNNELRHTARYTYASGSPAVNMVQLTTPDGVTRSTLSDQVGKTLSVSYSAQASDSSVSTFLYDQAGCMTVQRQPNYGKPPSGVPDDWQSTHAYDFLGQLSATSSADAGTVRFLRDCAGRKRFMLEAAGVGQSGAPDTVIYWIYDALGRVTEQGVVPFVWSDGTQLKAYADSDPGWPVGVAGAWWTRRYLYDTAPGGPVAPGRLCRIESTQTTDCIAQVIEDFAYQDYGIRTEHGIAVPGSGLPRTVTLYEEDYRSRKSSIAYPAAEGAAPPLVVTYAYDGAGRLVRVGTPSVPNFFAAYTYFADDTLRQETLQPGGNTPVILPFLYDSPQWISGVGDASSPWRQSVTYAPSGSGSGSYDGLASSDTQQYNWTGAPAGFTFTLVHDMDGRVSTAENTDVPAWSIDTPIRYDLNGNILALACGSASARYSYQPGSNQIATVVTETAGGPVLDVFSHDLNGSVTATSGLGLTYAPGSRLASAISVAGPQVTNIEFLYGGAGQRVVKTMSKPEGLSQHFYLHGLGASALVEKACIAGSNAATCFVYGKRGLLALHGDDGRCYWTTLDRQGSVRLVTDENGNAVATYDYLPFGAMARCTGELPHITNRRYAGMELDGETGLYNARARLYDPVLGRFYSCDPASQYASPYVYAGSDPFDMTDPTGRWSLDGMGIFGVVGAIVGAIIGAVVGFGVGGLAIGAAEAGAEAAGLAGAEAAGAEVAAAGAAEAGAAGPAAVPEAVPLLANAQQESWVTYGANMVGRSIGTGLRGLAYGGRALLSGVRAASSAVWDGIAETNPEFVETVNSAGTRAYNVASNVVARTSNLASAVGNQGVRAVSTGIRFGAALTGAKYGGPLGGSAGASLGGALYKDKE